MRTVVAITGASSGIGAAFARKLAAEHDLLLIARRRDRLEALADELMRRHGVHAEIMVADLSEAGDLQKAAERLTAEPRLALLVNNAGFGTRGLFWEAPLERQEQMHRLHIAAVLRLTHAALQNMVPRNFGAIINVASVAAYVRNAGGVSYSATKSWMTAFTEGLYLELRNTASPVRVQALCPGYTHSEFQDTMGISESGIAPEAFWLTAEEVVEASLNGLDRDELFVIPGWRYRLLIGFLSKIPTAVRLRIESIASRRRMRGRRLETEPAKQISQVDEGRG